MRRHQRVCSSSGDDLFSCIYANVEALCEEVSGKSALRALLLQVLQSGHI
jgi:hypothetical protein